MGSNLFGSKDFWSGLMLIALGGTTVLVARAYPMGTVLRMGAGVHTYTKPEPGLPVGISPAAAQFYHDAITGGFFVV